MDAPDLLARLGAWEEGRGSRSARLSHSIAAAIADGRLAPGTRLPPERELAGAIGVSRGTVVRSYASLRQRDLVSTTHGAGTTVAGDTAGPALMLRADGVVAAVGHRDLDTIDLRVAAWDGDDELAAALHVDAADQAAIIRRHDGYWPQGLPSLRAAIAGRLSGLGLPTDADQLLVTSGAQQAIDVVMSAVTRPGDPVIVEETTWPGLLELLPIRHLRPLSVPLAARDHIGLLRALRERRADIAYLIPSFHNPTGRVIPAPVRRLIVEAASASGALVVEDLTLNELWMDEPPPAPLATIVPEAMTSVISVGSLSKSVWGGLRIGWIRAEPTLLRRLAGVKTVLDLGSGVPSQLAALRALSGADTLVARRRSQLRERRDRTLAAMATHLPGWHVEPPAGGLSMWVDLGGADADAVAARAREHGVRIPSARGCSADGRALGYLRMTLARPAEELEAAVQRLALACADAHPDHHVVEVADAARI